jgi:hypothetical protein
MSDCVDCDRANPNLQGGIYSFKCKGCRNRFLMDEPCKMYRQIMADTIRQWGLVDDYQKEPHCKCEHQCDRMRTIRNAHLNS